MHTVLPFGTPEQKERYLRPLCEGLSRSCFALTEPEVAGSDPTLIQTHAVRDGDDWVINGHKWFISGARGALRDPHRRDRPRADPPEARNSAFIVDLPSEGWEVVRDVETKARWSRFADRADEVHLMRVATNAIGEFRKHGTLAGVFGHLPV